MDVIGGAIITGLASAGAYHVFSVNDEPERRDAAMDMLIRADHEWDHERAKRLEVVNEALRKEGKPLYTFEDVDVALGMYVILTGKDAMPPEPRFEDYYQPSAEKVARELIFASVGAVTLIYTWLKMFYSK